MVSGVGGVPKTKLGSHKSTKATKVGNLVVPQNSVGHRTSAEKVKRDPGELKGGQLDLGLVCIWQIRVLCLAYDIIKWHLLLSSLLVIIILILGSNSHFARLLLQ